MTNLDGRLFQSTPVLTLGTAILDDGYGITRSSKRYSDLEKAIFLQKVVATGISHIDTAPGYGFAERLVGEAIRGKTGVNVTTKISRTSCQSSDLLLESISTSRELVGPENLNSVLLHDSSVLQGELAEDVYFWMIQALETGRAKKIGVSVYSEDELLWIKKTFPKFTTFQLPASVLGRKAHASRNLLSLAELGNWLAVRSIFLQGLLLSDVHSLPTFFNPVRHQFSDFVDNCRSKQVSALEACVAYSKSIPWASTIVIGAENFSQFQDVASAFDADWNIDFSDFPELPLIYLDPRNWKIPI